MDKHYELNNYIVNKNLKEKWSSFGWNVIEIDGHNIEEIYDSLTINGINQQVFIKK